VKRLYLLRHAKSSWDDPGLADRDRPLAERGKEAAAKMAGHLKAQAIQPELVLCSPSLRTRQTLARIASAIGDPEVGIEDVLYEAEAAEILVQLRQIKDGIGSVMVLGHNPGLQDLVLELAADGRDLPRVRAKFPTAALATLEFEGSWHDLAPRRAHLTAYIVPKEIP
jgi:phosphohistidine phosphatase